MLLIYKQTENTTDSSSCQNCFGRIIGIANNSFNTPPLSIVDIVEENAKDIPPHFAVKYSHRHKDLIG